MIKSMNNPDFCSYGRLIQMIAHRTRDSFDGV
jgi:hypothetical protein